MWAVEKQYYEMPEFVGFQTIVIVDPNGMTFDAVGVCGLAFWLLFKSGSSYCELTLVIIDSIPILDINEPQFKSCLTSIQMTKTTAMLKRFWQLVERILSFPPYIC